eukprot:CAMPEP_0184717432 /NCGR_PEP_ID=MMETSP0314-20130426/6910_1 /TAXON_ID=38298 /ORGANISM="Rhodella maculata, Strain CCMP 736" /LENGTH=71 /DNA_ID=CAMNT_0027181003 /DNA_START=165 /DNA_END=380 /DNA_ORIENTATION=+
MTSVLLTTPSTCPSDIRPGAPRRSSLVSAFPKRISLERFDGMANVASNEKAGAFLSLCSLLVVAQKCMVFL